MRRSASRSIAPFRSPSSASSTLGRRADQPRDLERVLRQVGAEALGDRQLSELSGGELQRVVLARALIRSPGLLVLDEPVRGVDFAGEAELYTLIGRLRTENGFGVLLVSHDLHVVMAQSDRVHVPQPACVLLGRAGVGGPASRICAAVRPAGGARLRPLSPPP